MKSMELETVKTDLKLANFLLYPAQPEYDSNGKIDISQSDLNMAAYHSVQAMEKGLKMLLAEHGEHDLRTHSIEFLVKKLEEYRPDFGEKHKFMLDNGYQSAVSNTLRYGETHINKKDAYILLKEAKEFVREIEKEYTREGHSLSDLKQDARQEYYQNSSHVSYDTSNSKYDKSAQSSKGEQPIQAQSGYQNDNEAFRSQFRQLQGGSQPAPKQSSSQPSQTTARSYDRSHKPSNPKRGVTSPDLD